MEEKAVQELIAKYPWLLNQNFESIPDSSLPRQGMEFYIGGNRIDLVLRDRITKRPVIIEFKAVPFSRVHIGQIAEYRAQVILLLSEENALLKNIFHSLLSCPILCLVVPSCDEIARVACAMSGIDVYEYGNDIKYLSKPESIASLENIAEIYSKTTLPFDPNRCEAIDKIYKKLYSILVNQQLQQYWTDFRFPNGEYWYNLSHSFINKWIFRYDNKGANSEISLGIYEPVFENTSLNRVRIEYFSSSEESLVAFSKGIGDLPIELFGKPEMDKGRDPKNPEFFYRFEVPLELFWSKAGDWSRLDEVFLKVINAYKNGMRSIGKPLSEG
jgi:hypothetical protein